MLKKGVRVFCLVGLFLMTFTVATAIPGVMEGFGGVVIGVFLLYCALIVVAQLISALYAVRMIIDDLFTKNVQKGPSKRIVLR